MLIRDVPIFERPEEKALREGIENLNNQELIALILRTGSKNKSVLDLSLEVLKLFHDDCLSLESLLKIQGINKVKAIKLLSVFEFSKRINKTMKDKVIFSSPVAVYNYYKNYMNDTIQEKFLVLYLDIKNSLIQEKILFKGSNDSMVIDPKLIFNYGIKIGASKIICLHNHPSLNTNPSKEDINTTLRIKEIGTLVNIVLLDHLIIGNGFYSFKENDIIWHIFHFLFYKIGWGEMMKNTIRVKSMAGYLNFICDEKSSFPVLIGDLRERLEVIEQKKIKDIPCVIWLEGRELSESERLELRDTFQSFGINDFKSIN